MAVFQRVVLPYIPDLKCPGEPISKVMARTALQRLPVMHERLDRIGCNRSGELFLLCLLSADNRNRKKFLREVRIYIQHLLRALLRLLSGCMNRMAFLPQELS